MLRGMVCSGLVALFVVVPMSSGWAQDGDGGGGPDMGGDVRLRAEYKSPFDYIQTDGGEPTGDDGTFMRTRVYLDWELANNIGVFLQIQDSRVWGADSSTASPDLDMRQAYLTLSDLQSMEHLSFLGDNDLDLTIGRMHIPTLGDGYILSGNDWNNNGPSSWDGLWIDSTFGGEDLQFDVDLWYSDIANSDPNVTGPVGPNEGAVWWGLQVGTDSLPWVDGDVYFWSVDGDFGSFMDLKMKIYGIRLESDIPEDTLDGLSLFLEYAAETGELSSTVDLDASFMMVRGEYALPFGESLNPMVGLGISVASGDSNGLAGGDSDTWISPFAEYHSILGHYDLVANSNVQDIFFTFQATVIEAVDAHLDVHILTLDEDTDGLYTTTGFNGGAVTDDDIGTEIDLYAIWNCGSNLTFQAGWSYLMVGDATEQSTPTGTFDDDGHFFYLQMSVPFGHSDEDEG